MWNLHPPPFQLRSKIKILSTNNLFIGKIAAFCQNSVKIFYKVCPKIATYCPIYF